MEEHILRTLEDKGIMVPKNHVQPLLAQWEAFEQLKKNLDKAMCADYDIGLTHVPGGDQI
ncbi:hypothetical protein ACE1TI_05450 [Alteribacillus sp. JSM 102045]|uniref:hypothetical protein n=1 Tax=Alteribacillus sp. JSM 102045 TaxID=1562101 RepID=UPI0035BFEC7D